MIAREQSAGKHLPYARHVDDVTLETRDGLLMQTIRLGGLLFETADTEELNSARLFQPAGGVIGVFSRKRSIPAFALAASSRPIDASAIVRAASTREWQTPDAIILSVNSSTAG